jgi:hypothetical protein
MQSRLRRPAPQGVAGRRVKDFRGDDARGDRRAVPDAGQSTIQPQIGEPFKAVALRRRCGPAKRSMGDQPVIVRSAGAIAGNRGGRRGAPTGNR